MNFAFTEEQEMFYGMFTGFVAKEVEPKAEHIDDDEAVPMSLLEKAAMQGFLGALLPEDYAGAALDPVSYILLLEEISKSCMSLAMVLHVPSARLARRCRCGRCGWGQRIPPKSELLGRQSAL